MAYQIKYAYTCHIGKIRNNNEDNFWCCGEFLNAQNQGMSHIQSGCRKQSELPVMAVLDGMGGDDISAFKFQSLAQLAASIGESLIDPAQAENKLLAWVMQRYRMINALKWSVNRPDGRIAGTSVSGDEEALTAMGAVNAAIANATTRDKSILPSATRQTYRVEQRSDLRRYSNGKYNFYFSSSKFTWTDSLPNKIYTHVEAANSAIITGKYRAGWNLETSSEIGYSSPSELASCDPDIGQTVRGDVYITAYMIRNISSDFEYYDTEEEP